MTFSWPVGFRFRLFPVLVSATILVSCSQSGPKQLEFVNTNKDNRLSWCIGLIESGKIRRGMDTNSLKSIFGEWLELANEGEALAFLPLERADDRRIEQLPTPWFIKFSIGHDGLVRDFSLTKGSGK